MSLCFLIPGWNCTIYILHQGKWDNRNPWGNPAKANSWNRESCGNSLSTTGCVQGACSHQMHKFHTRYYLHGHIGSTPLLTSTEHNTHCPLVLSIISGSQGVGERRVLCGRRRKIYTWHKSGSEINFFLQICQLRTNEQLLGTSPQRLVAKIWSIGCMTFSLDLMTTRHWNSFRMTVESIHISSLFCHCYSLWLVERYIF